MEKFLLYVFVFGVFVLGYITGGLYYYNTLKGNTNMGQHIKYDDNVEYIVEFLFYPSVDVMSFPKHVIYDGKRYNVYVFNDGNKGGKIVYDTFRLPTIDKGGFIIINGDRIYLSQEQIDNIKNEGR